MPPAVRCASRAQPEARRKAALVTCAKGGNGAVRELVDRILHPMKVLITGASGFIGRNLADAYRGRFEVEAPPRAELDLLDAAAVRKFLRARRFDLVIHARHRAV